MDFGSLIIFLVLAVPLVLGVIAGVIFFRRFKGGTALRVTLSLLTGAATVVVVVAIAFAGCLVVVSA